MTKEKMTLGDYFTEKPSAEEGADEGAEIEAALGEGEETVASLAKQTGVSDPVALVKLIKKIAETC